MRDGLGFGCLLHLACVPVLPNIAGLRKNVVPFFWFVMGQDFLLIGPQLMHGLRKNRGLRFGCKFVVRVFHYFHK